MSSRQFQWSSCSKVWVKKTGEFARPSSPTSLNPRKDCSSTIKPSKTTSFRSTRNWSDNRWKLREKGKKTGLSIGTECSILNLGTGTNLCSTVPNFWRVSPSWREPPRSIRSSIIWVKFVLFSFVYVFCCFFFNIRQSEIYFESIIWKLWLYVQNKTRILNNQKKPWNSINKCSKN